MQQVCIFQYFSAIRHLLPPYDIILTKLIIEFGRFGFNGEKFMEGAWKYKFGRLLLPVDSKL